MSTPAEGTVLGMPLSLPPDAAGIQPLCAFVVVKAIDADGDICYVTSATDSLTLVECIGMAEYAMVKLKNALTDDGR